MKDKTSTKMGIYQWLNLSNNKIYIGSAFNFKSRKRAHLGELRRNVHHSEHLQAAFNKYGEEVFVFQILEEVTDKNLLKNREQYYLDLFQSYDPRYGYNMAHYADRPGIGLIPWNKDSWKKRVSEEQIISDYVDGLSTADLALKYHINLMILGKILNTAGVMRTISEAGKIYRKKNPIIKTYDKKKSDKEYYDTHRDIIVERALKWGREHKEKVLARAKKHYEDNKDQILKTEKEQYQNTPTTFREKYSQLLKIAKKWVNSSIIDFDSYSKLISNPCSFCKEDMLWSRGSCVKRVNKNLGFEKDNLVTCCGPCSGTAHNVGKLKHAN